MNRRTELSMGCAIDAPTCSICGEEADCSHLSPIVRYDEGPTLLSVSLVSVRCEECDSVMNPLPEFGHWACPREGCAHQGSPINNGIGALRESS